MVTLCIHHQHGKTHSVHQLILHGPYKDSMNSTTPLCLHTKECGCGFRLEGVCKYTKIFLQPHLLVAALDSSRGR